jgi:hypothetical protein
MSCEIAAGCARLQQGKPFLFEEMRLLYLQLLIGDGSWQRRLLMQVQMLLLKVAAASSGYIS